MTEPRPLTERNRRVNANQIAPERRYTYREIDIRSALQGLKKEFPFSLLPYSEDYILKMIDRWFPIFKER